MPLFDVVVFIAPDPTNKYRKDTHGFIPEHGGHVCIVAEDARDAARQSLIRHANCGSALTHGLQLVQAIVRPYTGEVFTMEICNEKKGKDNASV